MHRFMQWWPGNLSYKDFVADLAGTAAATAALLLAELRGRPTAASTLSSLAAGAAGTRYKPVPTADIELGLPAAAAGPHPVTERSA
jgi:hypothetical protein